MATSAISTSSAVDKGVGRGKRASWLLKRIDEPISLPERPKRPRGPYLLQASIAACHARARQPEETDWIAIAALYTELVVVTPSPVVQLNRAVAFSMAFGPQAGLDLVDTLVDEPTLESYHLLPSVRGDLLFKLGRTQEARSEFERAASLTRNTRERELLLERARACEASPSQA